MSSQLSQLPAAQSRVAGEMLMVLLAAALLTLPVALTLLALYERRILQSMASHSAGWPAAAGAEQLSAPSAPITIDAAEAGDERATVQPQQEADGTLAVTLSQPWRAAAIYSMAGISAASVLTVSQLLQGDTALLPGRFLLLTLVAMWPVVLTILLVAAATRRARATAVLAYLAGVAAIGFGELLVSPAFSWGQLTLLLLLVNVFPTLLVVIAINRKVRAVGPLVLAFLILALTGPVLVTGVLQRRQSLLRGVAGVGFDLGLGATGVIISIVLLSTIGFALPAWLILTGLGRAYERRRISDQSITVDALWLVVCTVSAVGLSYDNPRWLLTAPLAFGIYKLVAWAGFTVIGPDPDAPQRSGMPPRRLALLRVFDAQRAGCVWEIKELLQTVPPVRIVLLVDSTTDEQVLRDAIAEGWAALRADSPNVGVAAPALRVFRARSLGGATVRALLGELLAATERASSSTLPLRSGAA